MMYGGGWGGWLMGAVALVVLLIVVAGAVAVAFALRPRGGHAETFAQQVPQPSVAALEALDVRFARGEVDEDTYRRSREVLRRTAGW
jgi:uncharacterized membrane protein